MIAEQTCCFTGHRHIPPEHLPELTLALEQTLRTLISQGFRQFLAGGALGFDTLAAQTVLRLKREFPQIRLVLVLPCREQDKYWNATQRRMYREIFRRADEAVFLSSYYSSGCMHKRNRYQMASFCLCYLTGKQGGTSYTVEFAKRRGLAIFRLVRKKNPRMIQSSSVGLFDFLFQILKQLAIKKIYNGDVQSITYFLDGCNCGTLIPLTDYVIESGLSNSAYRTQFVHRNVSILTKL